jgi:uncharacterized protein (DUF1330 family)
MQSSTRLDLVTVYIIAQLKFTQRELYDRYQSRFAEVFRKFRGRLLVADERPEVLEGSFERDKVVVLEFPDRTAATEFHRSPEFAEIAADRKAGADAVVLLLRGQIDQPPQRIRAIDAWALTQAPH